MIPTHKMRYSWIDYRIGELEDMVGNTNNDLKKGPTKKLGLNNLDWMYDYGQSARFNRFFHDLIEESKINNVLPEKEETLGQEKYRWIDYRIEEMEDMVKSTNEDLDPPHKLNMVSVDHIHISRQSNRLSDFFWSVVMS